MFESTSKQPSRQPKLRSSCDACGNAKLKCDRAQPECGRCVSLGQPCVYSISKKTGRASRSSKQLANPHSTAAGRVERDPSGDVLSVNGTPAAAAAPAAAVGVPSASTDNIDATIRARPHVNGVAGAWKEPCENAEEMIMTPMSLETPDEMQLDRLLQLTDWSSLRLDDAVSSDLQTQTLAEFGTGDPEPLGNGPSPPKPGVASSQQFLLDDIFPPTPVSQTRALCSRTHTCYGEAYHLLGKLFSTETVNEGTSMSSSSSSSSSTNPMSTISTGTSSTVPLDHVLHMSRETTERLGLLLTCSCSKSSQNVVLYASILSRILLWYRQALGAEPSPHQPHAPSRTNDFDPFRGSSQSSLSAMESNWSSPAGGSINTSTIAAAMPSSLLLNSVAPQSRKNSYITVGSFMVDDRQVQMAVEMQLLAGELRRTGNQIDLFTTQNLEGLDEMTFHDVDVLYRCLGLWLKREYLRIADILRSRLNEVSH